MTDVADHVLRKTRILSERCATCITRPASERIALSNDRVREFIAQTRAAGGYVVCHETLPAVAPEGVLPAVCRGFADTYDTRDLRIIRAMWGFVEVDPPLVEDLAPRMES